MAGKTRDQDSEVRLGRWDAEVGHAGRIIPIYVDLRAQKVQSLFSGICEQTFLSPRSLNCLVFATSAHARHCALSS